MPSSTHMLRPARTGSRPAPAVPSRPDALYGGAPNRPGVPSGGHRQGTARAKKEARNRQLAKRLGPVLGAALAAGASLMIWSPWSSPPAPPRLCVVGLDTQGSTSAMAPTYQKWLPAQITACGKADKAVVVAMKVSGDTETTTTEPLTLDLSRLEYTGNPPDDAEIEDQAITDFTTKVTNSLFVAPVLSSHGTDLIALGCAVAPLTAKYGPTTIIVDTDGQNARGPYNFATIPMDDAHIQTYLTDLNARGQICDLHGASVNMYGVAVGALATSLEADRLADVHTFWTNYFTASHATLGDYQRTPAEPVTGR